MAASLDSLVVTQWNVDLESGTVTYDVSLNGLCDALSCDWSLGGYFQNEGAQLYQIGLGSGSVVGSPNSPVSFSRRVSGTLSGSTSAREITDLKAINVGLRKPNG